MQGKFLVLILASVITWLAAAAPAFALADGVYSVSNSTSYTNPDTGKTDDGGSNLDIGEPMARSLTQPLMLYEVKDGQQYLTIRIGLSSYITDMRISTQAEKNKGTGYQPVPFDVTKENKETDTTEYRFEVESLELRIRLTFFVGPMNRDVIFFITPDVSSVKSDEGAFAASDKAASGYGSGFAAGLTGGNAEKGEMPALVEQLTGVKQAAPGGEKAGQQEQTGKQTTAPAKTAPEAAKPSSAAAESPPEENGKQTKEETPPLASAQSPSPLRDSGNQSQAGAEKAEPKATPADTADAGAGKGQAAAAASGEAKPTGADQGNQPKEVPAPSAAAAASAVPNGAEEKVMAGSTARLADQGLTQFDSAGNSIEPPALVEHSDNILRFIGGAAVILAAAASYYLYRRSTKRV